MVPRYPPNSHTWTRKQHNGLSFLHNWTEQTAGTHGLKEQIQRCLKPLVRRKRQIQGRYRRLSQKQTTARRCDGASGKANGHRQKPRMKGTMHAYPALHPHQHARPAGHLATQEGEDDSVKRGGVLENTVRVLRGVQSPVQEGLHNAESTNTRSGRQKKLSKLMQKMSKGLGAFLLLIRVRYCFCSVGHWTPSLVCAR